MKHLMHTFIYLCLTFVAISPANALDCGDLDDVDQYGQLQIPREDIVKYVRKGCDPPLSWRPPAGVAVTAPGTGSTLTQGQNAPDMPPGKVGSQASISNSKWGFSLSLPPWQGFPCQLPGGTSICGGGSSGSGSGGSSGGSSGGIGSSGGCPMRDDASGTFGERIPVTSLRSKSLECGGSVTLGTTQYSIVPNATRVAIIESGQQAMKIYELKNVSVPTPTGGTTTTTQFQNIGTVPIPTYLCMPEGPFHTMEKSIDLRPPMPQIFAYTNSTPRLIVRISPDNENPAYDPFDPDEDAPPEKFLIVPVQGGVPKDLTGCAKETDHYKVNPPATSDIDIFPIAEPVCDVSTVYPNSASCPNKMLVAVLDDPLLVHDPASTAEFYPFSDRQDVMAKTTANSQLMMQSGSTIRIGASGLKFILPEGGVLPLKDGNFLRMNGITEINGGSSSISLKGGGQIETRNGEMVNTYSPNSTVTPNADLPYLVKPTKGITMPAGLMIPSKVNGYIRLPVTAE